MHEIEGTLVHERRAFLAGSLGAMVAGVWTLHADAQPTPEAPDAKDAERVLAELGPAPKAIVMADHELKTTSSNPLGPFYRAGAPFRGKVTPIGASGVPMILSGRVWSMRSRRAIAGAVLDVWQVDNTTRKYSAGGESGDFAHRSRVVCSETGAYELETVHPEWYVPSPELTRSAHIHIIATAPGHKRLVTEVFFEGDEKHEIDPMFKRELMVPVVTKAHGALSVHVAAFDVVLDAI